MVENGNIIEYSSLAGKDTESLLPQDSLANNQTSNHNFINYDSD